MGSLSMTWGVAFVCKLIASAVVSQKFEISKFFRCSGVVIDLAVIQFGKLTTKAKFLMSDI